MFGSGWIVILLFAGRNGIHNIYERSKWKLVGVIAALRSSQQIERLIIVQREDEALTEGTNRRLKVKYERSNTA